MTPVLCAATLTVTAAAVMAAWQSTSPPRPPEPPVPRAQIAAPSQAPVTPYNKWAIEDVTYIITDEASALTKTGFFRNFRAGSAELKRISGWVQCTCTLKRRNARAK